MAVLAITAAIVGGLVAFGEPVNALIFAGGGVLLAATDRWL